MTGHSGWFRHLVPLAVLLAGAVLAVVTLSGVLPGHGDPTPAAASAVPQVGRQDLNAVIYATQDKLRRLPGDAATWARLGAPTSSRPGSPRIPRFTLRPRARWRSLCR